MLSKRERILDVALPLFLQHGFEGVSMSMIGAAAGGSKATLYAYFPSKVDLFVALMERTWERQGSETAFPPPCDDVRAWVVAWVKDYLSHLYTDEFIQLHRLMIAEAARFPALGRRLFEAGPAAGLDRLRAGLEGLMRRGLVRRCEPAEAARQLRALAKADDFDALLWCAAPAPSAQAIARSAERVADTFLTLYRNPPAPTDADADASGRNQAQER